MRGGQPNTSSYVTRHTTYDIRGIYGIRPTTADFPQPHRVARVGSAIDVDGPHHCRGPHVHTPMRAHKQRRPRGLAVQNWLHAALPRWTRNERGARCRREGAMRAHESSPSIPTRQWARPFRIRGAVAFDTAATNDWHRDRGQHHMGSSHHEWHDGTNRAVACHVPEQASVGQMS
eukprot:scaffold12033_cov125-Isochrysis_galbana.AAC.4